MGFDQLSPVAPARIRCLLLPCGRISLRNFKNFSKLVEAETIVRLGDVVPRKNTRKGIFSSLDFPSGSILYDFSISDVPVSSRHLVPFELHKQPLVILGIADGSEPLEKRQQSKVPTEGQTQEAGLQDNAHHAFLSEKLGTLREVYSSAILHEIILFDAESEVSVPECVIPIPSEHQAQHTQIQIAMRDMTCRFLEELSSYAKSIQALPNIETPTPRRQRHFEASGVRSTNTNDFAKSAVDRSDSASPPVPSGANGDAVSLPSRMTSPLSAEYRPEATLLTSSVETARPPRTFDEISQERPLSASLTDKARSPSRVSVQGFGSGTIGERARNQAKGRLGVVLGSMYLLAGRWVDAIKELVESAIIAKWSNDHPWYAKALDYILVSLLMCGWAGLDFEVPQVCYPGEKPPWSLSRPTKASLQDAEGANNAKSINRLVSLRNLCQLLPDLVNHILYFYTRASTSSYSDKIPMLSFSETVIRYSKLLGIVRNSFCVLDAQCLQDVIDNASRRRTISEAPQSIESFSSTADIASLVFRAMPIFDPDDAIEVTDWLHLLAGISSVLSVIGCHRKKAFVLRELVTGMLPALIQSRKDDAAELGVHPAASFTIADLVTGSTLGETDSSSRYGADDQGTRVFLNVLCEIYGVVRANSEPAVNTSQEISSKNGVHPSHREADQIVEQAMRRGFGNPLLKIDILRWCINICEALPDLSGMLTYSSSLLTTASSGMAPGPESNDAYPSIPIEDQTRLLDTISRASSALKLVSTGSTEGAYWDDFLIREIEIISPTASDLPVSRRKQELASAGTTGSKKNNSPFIYNPFSTKSTTTSSEPTILLRESVTFMVLVQNLFDVNLEIEWLKLDVPDAQIDIIGRNITVGPYRTQKVYLTGVPQVLGQISIPGCKVKVKGCQARSFFIYETAWKPSEDKKIKAFGLKAGLRSKERPLSVLSDPSKVVSSENPRAPTPSVFVVNVIKNQPSVSFKPMSLSQSSVMVLLGQRKTLSITLVNESSDKIDFLDVSFTDSSSRLLQAIVDDKDASPADLYEVEYAAYLQPALRLLQSNQGADLSIEPNGELTLVVEIYGKPGLIHGAMQVSYAHLGVTMSEIEDRFYTRQLVVPIVATVNASVELTRAELLPYPDSQTQRANVPQDSSMDQDPNLETKERCILVLDFHNAWPRPLYIQVQFIREETSELYPNDRRTSKSELLQPGHSTRVMVQLPRIIVESPHAPVPAINPANRRQFVVSASKVSAELERLGREMFWYRQEILKGLKASWQEEESGRSGDINLRTMRLSPRMLDILKPDDLEIRLLIESSNPAAVIDNNQRAQQLSIDDFAKLTIRISNNGLSPIYPYLRLQPSLRHHPYNVALDLSRKFAYNGLLQRPLPLLLPKEMCETSLGIVFLCAGEYEIGACVEETRPWIDTTADERRRPRADTGDLTLPKMDHKERRIWYAKRPCLIDVVRNLGTRSRHQDL